MRNLKRVLSLALALVMVLGMMVIGTSAATFTDAEEITYTEAVDIVSAIGVINGYPAADGTYYFDADGVLTREQGAALICYLLLGKTTADKLVGSGNFSDVAVDRWSAGEIDYCANLGIVKGNPDGTFNPTGELTALAYGRMLLGALGYDGTVEGYTGENWATAITTDMIDAGLEVKGVAMDAQLTREQAAQMTLQALQATMVKYTTKGTSITVGGVEIVSGASEAEAVAQGDVYANVYGTTKAATLQFSEKYFPELKKDNGVGDAYGRPASYRWYIDAVANDGTFNVLKDTVITNVLKTPAYTYDVTGRLDTTLAQIAAKLELDINGASMTTAVKGDTVELYLNAAGEITNAVKLHTELGQITKVTKPADENAKYSYMVSVKTASGVANYKDTALTGFDAATMVKDTYVTVVKGTNTATVALADYVTGKQSATGTGYVKVDGAQKFLAGATWTADSNALNYTDTFNFFLDAKGLVIGTAKVAAVKVPTNIFYVTESKFVAGNTWTADKAQLAVTYLDGTKAVVDMAITVDAGTKYLNNKAVTLATAAAATNGAYYAADFYKYTVDANGNIATIAAVGADTTAANETFVDNTAVSFAKGSAAVTWVASPSNLTFYADENTTVTTITTRGVVTTTGYANFAAKDFTGVNVLMEYKGNEVKAIYIIGDAFSAEGSRAVVGVKVSVGDTYYNATKAKFYTDVVYNVAGVDTTYTVERATNLDGTLVALTTPDFAEIVVTAGVAALTDATDTDKAMYQKNSENVEKVAATYMVIDGVAKYFASDVAFYDVTNVAKNGVVADDGVVVGDIINYTTKMVNGSAVVDAVYTTYAAQEDGVLASFDATYLADVVNYAYASAENEARFDAGDITLIQYTVDKAATGLKFTFAHETNSEWVSDYTWTPYARTAGQKYVMTINWDMDPHDTWGAGTYTYTISNTDGHVYATGSFYYAG